MTVAALPTFGLAITVALAAGGPAKDDAWIAAQIARANELLAPGDVSFRWTIEKAMGEDHAEIHTREDRDALGALTERRDGPRAGPGVIDVFVVSMLEDVDEPGRHRKGVCWTQRQDKQRYILLSAEAPIGVLGHELGHFFGNGHSKVADNLMSYERTGGPVTLDAAQVARIHELTTTFLASGRLADAGVPRLLP